LCCASSAPIPYNSFHFPQGKVKGVPPPRLVSVRVPPLSLLITSLLCCARRMKSLVSFLLKIPSFPLIFISCQASSLVLDSSSSPTVYSARQKPGKALFVNKTQEGPPTPLPGPASPRPFEPLVGDAVGALFACCPCDF